MNQGHCITKGSAMNRRTRIVATLGPATDRPGVLEELLRLGLNVVRINFSHGTAEEHTARVAHLRQLAGPQRVAVLGDLPGPKLRVLLSEPLTLLPGSDVTFSAADVPGPGELGVTEPECVRDVQPGHRILLDDGRLQLRAVQADGQRVVARVEVGGKLSPKKGINLPDTPLTIPSITAVDHAALRGAAQAGVDWLALSFVRGPDAATAVRQAAAAVGLRVPVMAKIERPEAVERAPAIVAAFDGIMVARGDLGVETPLEQVPSVQKRLIALARSAGKPVITATDMLDSMRTNPRPTRAEVSDVANAIYDGTDAVMLSGETAVGDYPREAVACMDRIAREAEADSRQQGRTNLVAAVAGLGMIGPVVDDPITRAACELALEVGADVLITPTLSGQTARLLARHRPWATVVAPAIDSAVLRQLEMTWGVTPVPLPSQYLAGDDRMAGAVRAAFTAGAARVGQLAVVLAGHPIEGGPRLPTIRVVRIGPHGSSDEP
jgi:pyruvate kinase